MIKFRKVHNSLYHYGVNWITYNMPRFCGLSIERKREIIKMTLEGS